MIRFLILAFIISTSCQAASVDTVSIYSNAMHKSFKCVVIKPEKYKKEELKFPVVYLLHGYTGWYANWIKRYPQIKEYADRYNIIIVCPDGGSSSWYFDSPVDSSMKYETYIGKEVPAYIDAHYHTIKDRKGRAIMGSSMGGHGAFFIAFRNTERFGACGSTSGAMDMNTLRTRFDVIKRLGDTVKHATNWTNYSVVKLVESLPKDRLAIIFDCGTDDLFTNENRALHQKMLQLKIPHEYTDRPGKHEWAYWTNAIQYHFLFFSNYFGKNFSKN
jgi:S-formylglutathione hydrolase FrmB